MTAPGVATYLVEVKLGASWVDMSSRVTPGGVTITHGRDDETGPLAPASAGFELWNLDGALTPDSPASPWWPYVVERCPVRITCTAGATTSGRFYGYVTSWAPSSLDPTEATVAVECADLLARADGRDLRDAWVEREASLTTVPTDPSYAIGDVWPLDDGQAPRTFTPLHADTAAGVVVDASTGVGTVRSCSPDGLSLSGGVQTESVDGVGPVIRLDRTRATADAASHVQFGVWAQIDKPDIDNGSAYAVTLLAFLDFRSRMIGEIVVYLSPGGHMMAGYWNGLALSEIIPSFDDGWHPWLFATYGGSTDLMIYSYKDDAYMWSIPGADLHKIAYVVLGGRADRFTPGKHTHCPPRARYAGVVVQDAAYGLSQNYARPLSARYGHTTRSERTTDLRTLCGITESATLRGTSASTARVAYGDYAGRSVLDCMRETLSVTQSLLWVDPAETMTTDMGHWQIIERDAQYPDAVALTIDVEADGYREGAPALRRGTESAPTTVTCQWPGGSTTVGPTTVGVPLMTESVSAPCATVDQAVRVAGDRLSRSVGLRVSSVGIDLATATTDRYAAAWSLYPTARVRLTGIDPAVLAQTTIDAHVQGWTEEYTPRSSRMLLRTTPADRPARTRVDGIGERVGTTGALTVTGGTCIGTTGLGTITTAAGVADTSLTVDPAQYPLTLSWRGETITVTAPTVVGPVATLTVTGRGLAGTVARAHAAGEEIDVAVPAATF